MPKILLIEDDEMNRDMLSRRLRRKGFEVITAIDGRQGLDLIFSSIANEVPPELILMDMSLPVLDGWEATRQIKSNSQSKNIPIIALTAHAMLEDRAKSLEAGCDDYDTKPIDLKRLLEKIKSYLGG